MLVTPAACAGGHSAAALAGFGGAAALHRAATFLCGCPIGILSGGWAPTGLRLVKVAVAIYI